MKENYNPILNAPLTEEQKDRMNKFRNFLIQDAKNISTQDLLENIANVINNTYSEELTDERKLNSTNIPLATNKTTSLMNNFFNASENDPNAIENNRVVSGNEKTEDKENKDGTKKYS